MRAKLLAPRGLLEIWCASSPSTIRLIDNRPNRSGPISFPGQDQLKRIVFDLPMAVHGIGSPNHDRSKRGHGETGRSAALGTSGPVEEVFWFPPAQGIQPKADGGRASACRAGKTARRSQSGLITVPEQAGRQATGGPIAVGSAGEATRVATPCHAPGAGLERRLPHLRCGAGARECSLCLLRK